MFNQRRPPPLFPTTGHQLPTAETPTISFNLRHWLERTTDHPDKKKEIQTFGTPIIEHLKKNVHF